ncbi:hypothetical protein [Propylenella binzhouense]|nr:hypothetical protein [Propylenella binzhouense]
MGAYSLNKVLRDINRNPGIREEFFKSKDSVLDRYDLTDEEKRAIRELDIGTLYRSGAHGLILRPFTLLHQVPEPDYLKAIRG